VNIFLWDEIYPHAALTFVRMLFISLISEENNKKGSPF